jgi:hypothetical protein
MPKRPAAQETLALSLELLRRIPRRGGITATELREQLRHAGFEREPRTLQRLLKTLCECCDIECDDSSKPYHYRWKENAKILSAPRLSAQDALLKISRQQLKTKINDNLNIFKYENRDTKFTGNCRIQHWNCERSEKTICRSARPGIQYF